MIQFPQRSALIKETQSEVPGNLNPDGIDGRATWRAIGMALKVAGADKLSARPSSVRFPERKWIVKEVQARLGFSFRDQDGDDGPQTWAALAQAFDPKPINFPTSPDIRDFKESDRGRSPNRNPGINSCEGIVVHHAAGYFEGTIDWCMRKGTYAAYHCLIAPDGTRAILGQDEDRCHHAGESVFQGRSSCNNFMLGVAFCGDTNSGMMRPGKALTAQELASLEEWVEEKMAKYGFGKDRITHHRVVSPGRKDDLSLPAWKQVVEVLSL